jgi:hypothetical protein
LLGLIMANLCLELKTLINREKSKTLLKELWIYLNGQVLIMMRDLVLKSI